MKKKINIYFVILLILIGCSTGCTKDDYQNYLRTIGKGISCTYTPDGKANKIDTLEKFTVKADDKKVVINYVTSSGTSDHDYVIFKFNNKNEITGVDYNEYHDLGSIIIHYKNFKSKEFFENYNGKCPDIYFEQTPNTNKYLPSINQKGKYHYINSSSSTNSSAASSNNIYADRMSCDFLVRKPNNELFGTVKVLIDKDYKIQLIGKDKLSSYNFSIVEIQNSSGSKSIPAITSNSFLNANGDFSCSAVGKLPMAKISDKDFTICYSTNQCKTGETGWTMSYDNTTNSGGSSGGGSSGSGSSGGGSSGGGSSGSGSSSSSTNTDNKLSCDYTIKNSGDEEYGTVTISIGKDYKITAKGNGNISSDEFTLKGITSDGFLNANGDLDCSAAGKLPIAKTSEKKFDICYTASQCNTGDTSWKLVLGASNKSSSSGNSGDSGDSGDSGSVNIGGDVGNTSSSGACNPSTGLGPTLVFVGHLVRVAKILIPLVIIAFGIMDFFRAITAGKDDEIKKSSKTFVWRLIAGVIIFFLPALISFVFSWIENWGNYEGSYEECFKCVWDVGKCIK